MWKYSAICSLVTSHLQHGGNQIISCLEQIISIKINRRDTQIRGQCWCARTAFSKQHRKRMSSVQLLLTFCSSSPDSLITSRRDSRTTLLTSLCTVACSFSSKACFKSSLHPSASFSTPMSLSGLSSRLHFTTYFRYRFRRSLLVLFWQAQNQWHCSVTLQYKCLLPICESYRFNWLIAQTS